MNSRLITALVTPFDECGMLDEMEFKRLIEDVIDQGSEGILIGGTTGEGANLDVDELIKLLEIAREYENKVEIVINIGLNSTHKTIKLINKIKDYKHTALMIIVPYYNKPNKEGIYEHFKYVADTFKNEKFILYNVPNRTIVKLESDILLKLIEECPNIIGLKHASDDFSLVKIIKEKYPNFLIYSGDDKYILDMLKLGANGVISVVSHVFGKDIKELIDDYYNEVENNILDKYIKELSNIIFCDTNPIPIKYVLSKKGYKSMNLRLPLVKLSKDKCKEIDIILNL